ncbi:MAG: hypothetical protein M3290_05065 [Actinomycetota bacterium]|nr:hypothetical protein [Actinomycetota bacterium]
MSDRTDPEPKSERSSPGSSAAGEPTVPPVDLNRVSEQPAVIDAKNRGRLALALVIIVGGVIFIGAAQALTGHWDKIRPWWNDVFPWITAAVGAAAGYYFGKNR